MVTAASTTQFWRPRQTLSPVSQQYDRTNCDTSHNVYRCLQKGYYLLNRGIKRHNVTSHWYFPILYFMFLFTLCVFVSKQVQYNIKPENRPTLVSGFTFHKQTCMVYFGSLFSPLRMCLSEIKLQLGYLDFHCFLCTCICHFSDFLVFVLRMSI